MNEIILRNSGITHYAIRIWPERSELAQHIKRRTAGGSQVHEL